MRLVFHCIQICTRTKSILVSNFFFHCVCNSNFCTWNSWSFRDEKAASYEHVSPFSRFDVSSASSTDLNSLTAPDFTTMGHDKKTICFKLSLTGTRKTWQPHSRWLENQKSLLAQREKNTFCTWDWFACDKAVFIGVTGSCHHREMRYSQTPAYLSAVSLRRAFWWSGRGGGRWGLACVHRLNVRLKQCGNAGRCTGLPAHYTHQQQLGEHLTSAKSPCPKERSSLEWTGLCTHTHRRCPAELWHPLQVRGRQTAIGSEQITEHQATFVVFCTRSCPVCRGAVTTPVLAQQFSKKKESKKSTFWRKKSTFCGAFYHIF